MKKSEKRSNPLINMLLNIFIPSLIMMKFSGPEHFGQFLGLTIALSFPIGYGLFELISNKTLNFFSILGIVSVLLTGGIGLLQLSRNWMVAKETAIPLLFGIATFISEYTRYPLVRVFLGEVIKLDDVDEAFSQNGYPGLFQKKLIFSSKFLTLSFFLSALLNYILAVAVLKGNPGTVEFTESLGKMTALSLPVITVPMMFMMGFVLYYLCHSIKKHTQHDIEKFLRK